MKKTEMLPIKEMNNTLTTIILSKNEENTIERAIRSVLLFSKVLVIDDYSTDTTALKAQKMGATVLKRNLSDNFAAQRNYGLHKAKTNWAFFLDADEIVTPSLRKAIGKAIAKDGYDGYYVRRQDIWKGKKLAYGEWGKIYLLRLGKVSKGRWHNKVHEVWNIEGKISKLNTSILHYPHETVHLFISHISFHSKLHAMQKSRKNNNNLILKVIFYPIFKFGYNYIVKMGYKDGIHGFIYSILMSFHSFLAWSTFYLTLHEKKN